VSNVPGLSSAEKMCKNCKFFVPSFMKAGQGLCEKSFTSRINTRERKLVNENYYCSCWSAVKYD